MSRRVVINEPPLGGLCRGRVWLMKGRPSISRGKSRKVGLR